MTIKTNNAERFLTFLEKESIVKVPHIYLNLVLIVRYKIVLQ